MIKLYENDKYKQNEKNSWKGRQKDQNKRPPQRSINSKPLLQHSVLANYNRQYEANQIPNKEIIRPTKTHADTKKDRIQTRMWTETYKNNCNKIDNIQLNQLSQNNLFMKQKSNKKQQNPCQNYFLRKTIFFLFTFFNKSEFIWDVNKLTYRQLLAILKELKYIRYSDQQSYTDSSKQVSEQLKNISQGKTFTLLNLIIALCCLQNLTFDSSLIQDIIQQLSQQINDNKIQSNQNDPRYIFFTKKQPLTFQHDILKPTPKEITKIQHSLKCFRDTKMMSSSSCPEEKLEHQTEQQSLQPLLSKKSKQLAGNRRQKILQKIKRSNPQIQQIQLHHILSYKQNIPVKAQNEAKQKQSLKADKKQKPSNKKPKQKESKGITNKCKQNTRFKIKQHLSPQDLKQKCQGNINFQTENNQESEKKMEIIDQLEWEEIPKLLEDITFQNQLLNFKDDFKIAIPLSQSQQTTVPQQSEKQKKRREYLQLPILYVDVNIEEGKKERIVIYQGDKAIDLAVQFCKKHGLSTETISQLEMMLQQQIGSVLTKIQEAIEQDCSYLY